MSSYRVEWVTRPEILFQPKELHMLRTILLLTVAAVFAGCAPAPQSNTNGKTDKPTTPATPVVYKAAETPELTMEVPAIHCQACFGTVKEKLEEMEGVESVKLVKQEKEDELTDKRVVVKLKGDFNATAAIEKLAEASFEDSKVDEDQVKTPETQETEEPEAETPELK